MRAAVNWQKLGLPWVNWLTGAGDKGVKNPMLTFSLIMFNYLRSFFSPKTRKGYSFEVLSK